MLISYVFFSNLILNTLDPKEIDQTNLLVLAAFLKYPVTMSLIEKFLHPSDFHQSNVAV